INQIICDLGVDFYFKHPREKYIFKGVEYIESNEIFESYLESYIKEHPNTQVELYSFISTVMFNVSNFSNVRLFALVDEELYQKYSYLYDVMAQFNVEKLWMK
ncbi:glycosyltransferase family 52, partial [Acinetobacter lactucae]|uniref:glycosyltransferase family 52 n=1 Tax=Acinetobacter lactucae TaxID=1785128 RepID=UPI001C2E24ED